MFFYCFNWIVSFVTFTSGYVWTIFLSPSPAWAVWSSAITFDKYKNQLFPKNFTIILDNFTKIYTFRSTTTKLIFLNDIIKKQKSRHNFDSQCSLRPSNAQRLTFRVWWLICLRFYCGVCGARWCVCVRVFVPHTQWQFLCKQPPRTVLIHRPLRKKTPTPDLRMRINVHFDVTMCCFSCAHSHTFHSKL